MPTVVITVQSCLHFVIWVTIIPKLMIQLIHFNHFASQILTPKRYQIDPVQSHHHLFGLLALSKLFRTRVLFHQSWHLVICLRLRPIQQILNVLLRGHRRCRIIFTLAHQLVVTLKSLMFCGSNFFLQWRFLILFKFRISRSFESLKISSIVLNSLFKFFNCFFP